MSIILDALRKSESDRLREAEAHHAGVPRVRPRARMPWWVWVVATLLLGNLALLGWLLHGPVPRAPTNGIGPAAAVRDLERVALAGRAVVGAVAARQAAEGAPRRTPDVPPTQYPVRAPDEGAPAATLDAAAAAAIEAESAARVATPAAGSEDPPPTLPAGLGPLEVSLHYFDGPGGNSFLTINGHTARAGTVLPEGPIVEQVTPEGAILNYRGQRFLLPRN